MSALASRARLVGPLARGQVRVRHAGVRIGDGSPASPASAARGEEHDPEVWSGGPETATRVCDDVFGLSDLLDGFRRALAGSIDLSHAVTRSLACARHRWLSDFAPARRSSAYERLRAPRGGRPSIPPPEREGVPRSSCTEITGWHDTLRR